MEMEQIEQRGADVVAGAMMGVGALHFVATDLMATQIPDPLPNKRELVLISGVIEVATGYALWKRKPWAGKVAAATLLAVWPANIKMAVDAGSGRNPGIADDKAVMWARVPMQLPMIWAALKAKPRT